MITPFGTSDKNRPTRENQKVKKLIRLEQLSLPPNWSSPKRTSGPGTRSVRFYEGVSQEIQGSKPAPALVPLVSSDP